MAIKTVSPILEILRDHENGAQQFQNWLNYQLHQQVVCVTFTKVDGTERVMRCTLNGDIVPKAEWDKITENRNKPSTPKKAKPSSKSTDDLFADLEKSVKPSTTRTVYDVDTKSWRSFRWDSITLVEYDDEHPIGNLFVTQ